MPRNKALEAFYREGSVFLRYMNAIEGVTEAPERFHIGTMLAILGAAVGRNAVLNYGPHHLYPITPVVLVGPSGIGKGEALGVGKRLLKSLKMVTNKDDDDSSMAGAEYPSIWILQDEATPSALIKAYTMTPNGKPVAPGENAPEIAIIAGEMATFMSKTGEKEGMVPIMTKLLEQDDSYVRTLVKDLSKGQHQNIKKPTLSFVAGTTVDWMRKMMPSEMFAGGFFRRCIMIVEAKKGCSLEWPVLFDDVKLQKLSLYWGDKLKLFLQAKEPVAMNMDQSRDYWRAFKRRHDSNAPDDPRLIGHYNSYPQHVMRTALTFAIAEGRVDILPADLRAGEAWILSLMPDVQEILLQGETFGFAENAQLLERIMINEKRAKLTDLWKKIRLPKRQFEELIEWGQETKLITVGGGDRNLGEVGRYVKLVGKGRTSWGKVRG